MKKNQKKAYTYALIAVLIWSTVGSAFKIALRELDTYQLLFFSTLCSFFSIAVILIAQNKFNLLKKISHKGYSKLALFGLINPTLYYIVLFKAYDLLPAQEAQPINYTWPIMLVLLSVPFLKQKIDLKGLISIAISFFGVLIISTRGDLTALNFSNPTGAFLALLTAVIWAFYWLLCLKDRTDDTVRLFVSFGFGTLYTAIVTIVMSDLSLPSLKAFLGSAYVGLFEMGITFVIWANALRYSERTDSISNLVYLVPFLSLIVIYFAVGERILPSSLVGLFFIILGVVVQRIRKKEAYVHTCRQPHAASKHSSTCLNASCKARAAG